MNFDMVQKSLLTFGKVSELNQMRILHQTASISLVRKLDKS